MKKSQAFEKAFGFYINETLENPNSNSTHYAIGSIDVGPTLSLLTIDTGKSYMK